MMTMNDERRKFIRFECLLPAEIVKLNEKKPLLEKVTVDDFSQEGLKLVLSFNLKPGADISLKLCHPETEAETPVNARIVWTQSKDGRLEMGLQISEMDAKSKSEIFDYIYDKWKDTKSKS